MQAGQSLRLYRAAEDLLGEVNALDAIGWHLAQLGDHQRAAGHRGQAGALRRAFNAEFATSGAGLLRLKPLFPAPKGYAGSTFGT
jgi:hypothetical protein